MTRDKKPYRILVIEDNPGDFVIVEDFLNDFILNPVVVNAVNFKQAAAVLSGGDKAFDVVLLDVTLPDKSGQVLITEMLLMAPLCPIIILTGYTDVDFSIKSISQGIMDYLLKDDLSPGILYKSIVYSIERKRAVSDLKESEKRYSDLFHLSPQPMWVYELATLRFLDVNDASIKHYGYTREEFLAMTVNEIFPKEYIPWFDRIVLNSKQNDQYIFQGVIRHKNKGGEILDVEIHSNAVLFKEKKARIVLINDVTERVKYIEAIEKQNKKLREIAWIQSHIVRAPLARMLGIMNLVKELKTESQESEELLGYLADSCNELDVIIRDIAHKSHEANVE